MKATSPDGEVRFFRSIKDAARELGFSECGVGTAYHDGRNRIGQHELEWLEPEPVEEPRKIKPRRKPRNTTGEIKKKVEEKMNKAKEENVRGRMLFKCTFCGKELDGKDISDYFIMEELDSSGNSIDLRTYKSLYEASQDTKISLNARNARDKANTVIVRRRDKNPFRISWSNIHPKCFEAKKEIERSEERERLEEAKRREALSRMNKEELVEFKRKEEEFWNKKDIAFEKLFNRVFSRDTLNKDN